MQSYLKSQYQTRTRLLNLKRSAEKNKEDSDEEGIARRAAEERAGGRVVPDQSSFREVRKGMERESTIEIELEAEIS